MFRAFDDLSHRALHQVPTLIGCLLLKNFGLAAQPAFACRASLLSNRFVCQQQRNEIMKLSTLLVNYFLQNFSLRLKSTQP
jgi:hypothetical protein